MEEAGVKRGAAVERLLERARYRAYSKPMGRKIRAVVKVEELPISVEVWPKCLHRRQGDTMV
jgi:hypothetical protein